VSWAEATRDVLLDSLSCSLFSFRPTAPQRQWLEESSPIALWRDGNQLGKTTGSLVDLVHRCRGTHPWQTVRRPPVYAVVVGVSLEQMGQPGGIMEKLYNLIPTEELDPKTGFEPGRGITGKPPRLVFRSGPGAGSVIFFGTFKQDPTRYAGSTIHHVLSDEPMPAGTYEELRPRLLKYGGTMRINFTPVPNMPDMQWLRDLIDRGVIVEHNHGLKPENCLPDGAPCPYYSRTMLDSFRASLPLPVQRMRIEGAWDPLVDERWISAFSTETHVRGDEPPAGAVVFVGIDHGIVGGKQAAVVGAVVGADSLRPRVWYLAEHVGHAQTSQEEDARAIVSMLHRAGLEVEDVDLWVGDRPADARGLVRKSNSILRRHLAALAGIAYNRFPRITTPRKFDGSVVAGLTMLNSLSATDTRGTPHLLVSPRCPELARAFMTFQGHKQDPAKDILDAARYPVERLVGSQRAVALSLRYG
jgi:hypothetical protein